MKKIIILMLPVLVLLSSGVYLFSLSDEREPQSPVLGDSKPQASSDNTVALGEYEALWYQVEDVDRLVLGSNLKAKEAASGLFEDQACSFLINGGFYSPELEHLGLFLTEGETLSPVQENVLLNGFVSINSLGIPKIGVLPDEELRLAMQTGPMLVANGEYKELTLTSDKYARRSIAMVTGSNELVFMIVYSGETRFSGPLLAETPELIRIFGQKTGLPIADAINLDGGKASAFITERVALTELSTIGSYFCMEAN